MACLGHFLLTYACTNLFLVIFHDTLVDYHRTKTCSIHLAWKPWSRSRSRVRDYVHACFCLMCGSIINPLSFIRRSENMVFFFFFFVLWLQLEGSRNFSVKGKEVSLSSKRG